MKSFQKVLLESDQSRESHINSLRHSNRSCLCNRSCVCTKDIFCVDTELSLRLVNLEKKKRRAVRLQRFYNPDEQHLLCMLMVFDQRSCIVALTLVYEGSVCLWQIW